MGRLAMYFAVAGFVLASCSRGKDEDTLGAPRMKTVKVVFSRAEAEGAWFGLNDSSPAFIGLSAASASGGEGDGAFSKAVAVGNGSETAIEVPTGKVTFRSTLVSAKEGDGFLYYSQAAQDTVVDASTAEVVLKFVPYKPVRPINVYGLVHLDKTTPAAGARVRLLDPFTLAPVTEPGKTAFAVTDARGTFAGSYPFDAFPGLRSVKLEVTLGAKTWVQEVKFLRGNAPGVTLPFLNLQSGGSDVVPRFSKLSDFDNDGTPNDFELAAGTNPFSELSGARGKDGSVTLVKSGVASALQCPGGGATIDYVLDVDGSLTVSDADKAVGATQVLCNGAQGAVGGVGPAGVNGANGMNGTSLRAFDLLTGVQLPVDVLLASDPQISYSLFRLGGKKIWARPVLSGSDLGVNPNICIGPVASGGQGTQCGDNSRTPYPLSLQACFFGNSTCAGSCYLTVRPQPNFVLAVAVSGGGSPGLVFASPASPSLVQMSVSGGFYSYSNLGGGGACQSVFLSGGTTISNMYQLDPYPLPPAFPVPVRPFTFDP